MKHRSTFLWAALIALSGCSESKSGNGHSAVEAGPDGGGGAASNEPTFTNVFRNVLQGCVQTQCHGAGVAGGLRMDGRATAYQNLVGIVAAGPCVKDAGGEAGEAGGGDGGPDLGASLNVCGCGPSGQTRVVPGKPDESLLVHKLTMTQTCGEQMPPTGEPVGSTAVDLVRQSITDGAEKDF